MCQRFHTITPAHENASAVTGPSPGPAYFSSISMSDYYYVRVIVTFKGDPFTRQAPTDPLTMGCLGQALVSYSLGS